MKGRQHDAGLVESNVRQTLGQLVRFLHFDGAVLYWYVPEFNMLWPLIQFGDLQSHVTPVMPGSRLIGEAFGVPGPIVSREANIAADGDAWLRSEGAQTSIAVSLGTGVTRTGVVVAFSRRNAEVGPEMLRTVTIFASQMDLFMRKAPLYAVTDLQRYQIEALTRIIGAAASGELADEDAMYQKIALQARLLTGAHTVTFSRGKRGRVFTEDAPGRPRVTFLRDSTRRRRRAWNPKRTVLRYKVHERDITLGLLWRCSFNITRDFRKTVELLGHALASIENLRARLAIAERERRAQYLADVSKSLSVSLEPAIVFDQIETLLVPEVADCVAFDLAAADDSGEPRRDTPIMSPAQRLLYDAVKSLGGFERSRKIESRAVKFAHTIEGNIVEAIVSPMISPRGIIGTMVFGRSSERGEAKPDDWKLYEELTMHVASALANATSFRKERDIADLLQHALLATALPCDRRVLFDAAYVPGAGSTVGGDWYDVFALDEDRYAVSVGDVGGHGTTAAITMNVVRLAFRAAALGGIDPVHVLERGDAMLQLEDDAPMVTAIYGVVDLRRGAFSYACAGHVPPYLAAMDGNVRALRTAGHPLGTGLAGERMAFETPLAPGDTLLFYTDGLVEYTRDLFAGEKRLRDLLQKLVREAPRSSLARRLHEAVFHGGVMQHDDVAILTIAIRPNCRTVEWHMPAIPSTAPRLRANLRDFWNETPLGDTMPFDFLNATGEAIANGLEHAYVDSNGGIRVRASYDERGVDIEVSDRGRYKSNGSSPDRGRGMAIMEALAREVRLEHDDDGTRVHLAFR